MIATGLFTFWLLVMVLIWLYLLDIASLIAGHFTPAEIALTVIIGTFSLFGIVTFFRHRSQTKKYLLAILFFSGFAIQYGFLLLSFRLGL